MHAADSAPVATAVNSHRTQGFAVLDKKVQTLKLWVRLQSSEDMLPRLVRFRKNRCRRGLDDACVCTLLLVWMLRYPLPASAPSHFEAVMNQKRPFNHIYTTGQFRTTVASKLLLATWKIHSDSNALPRKQPLSSANVHSKAELIILF